MNTLSLTRAAHPPTELVALTVEQYHRMLAAGVVRLLTGEDEVALQLEGGEIRLPVRELLPAS